MNAFAPSARQLPTLVCLCLALLVLAPVQAALAGPVAEEPLATVSVETTVIRFSPTVDADAWVLQVTGSSGVVLRREVSAQRVSELVIPRAGEGALGEGHYTYSLAALRADRTTREVQAGGFSLAEGGVYIASAENVEASPSAAVRASGSAAAPFFDFPIYDDLIVDGSTCIGFDCVVNVAFSYTTLALAENNLRIQFFDTSTAAGFPRHDWRIEINSSLSGGGNHFAIIDCGPNGSVSECPDNDHVFLVEGNAPANSMRIDSSGRLGLGTANPVVEIESAAGDTPTLRLNQDGTSGWAPQTWDVAGNETNFFVRDATNGSTLPLRIRPGAPSNMIYIRDSGVAMGHTSPGAQLDVKSTAADRIPLSVDTAAAPTSTVARFRLGGLTTVVFNNNGERQNAIQVAGFDNGSNEGPYIQVRHNDNSSTPASGSLVLRDSTGTFQTIWPDATGVLRIDSRTGVDNAGDTGGTVVGTQTSWFEYKEDIEPWSGSGALQAVRELPLFAYRFAHDSQRADKLNHGLVVFEADRDAWWVMNAAANQTPVLDEANLFGRLIGAIQELDTEVGEKQRTIDELTARVEALEAALDRILEKADGSR